MREPGVIIIPVFDALPELLACLESVAATTPNDVPVIVVNDCSGTEMTDRLEQLARAPGDRSIILVEHDQRRGFSAAVNSGMAAAIAHGFTTALILNSDTVLIGDAAERLLAAVLTDGYAMVGPLSNAAGDQSIPRQLPTFGERITLRTARNVTTPESFARYCHTASATSAHGSWSSSHVDVPRLHGFAFACRLDAVDAVGLLDAEAFGSGRGSETDLAFRLRADGWRLAVVLDAFIWHAGSRSTNAYARALGVLRSRRQLIRRYGRAEVRSVKASAREALRPQAQRDDRS